MANISASALNSLQTKINAERSRRSLSPVTFTDGTHGAGDIIKATHFNELRSYTETLNTLSSQTFNWSGAISVGASITDVLTQIDNFVTTLENEALTSWNTLNPLSYDGGWNYGTSNIAEGARWVFQIPSAAFSANNVRVSFSDAMYSPKNICAMNHSSTIPSPIYMISGGGTITNILNILTMISNSSAPSLQANVTWGIGQHQFPGVIAEKSYLKGFRRGNSSPIQTPNANIYCNSSKWDYSQGFGGDPMYINEETMYATWDAYASTSAIGQGSYFYNEVGGFNSSWKYLVIGLGLSAQADQNFGAMVEPTRTDIIKVEAYY